MQLDNLHFTDINLAVPPQFNMKEYEYWGLNNVDVQFAMHIKKLFTPHECAEIIKLGRSYLVDESKTFDGLGFSDIRKSKNSWIKPSELSRWIYSRITDAITEVNKYYEYDLNFIEPLQFTEYDEKYKGYYSAHVDPSKSETSPNAHRKLTFSIQLTSPETYDGGDLKLYEDFEHPYIVNKEIGTINFFPSYVLHEVTPVTKGTRYSLVSWINGPKFK